MRTKRKKPLLRWQEALLQHPCPTCGVAPGKFCITTSGRKFYEPHADRARLAATTNWKPDERKHPMQYDVVIKATLKSEDDVEVDVDTLGEALVDEIDNVDIEVDGDPDGEDDVPVSYNLNIADIDITASKE